MTLYFVGEIISNSKATNGFLSFKIEKKIMCICKPKKCEIFNFWKMKSHKVTQSHSVT